MDGSKSNLVHAYDNTSPSLDMGRTIEASASTVAYRSPQSNPPTGRCATTSEESRDEGQKETDQNASKIVSFVDTDVEAAVPPPVLSRQEPMSVTAPHLPRKNPFQRMIVDVDDFIEADKKEEEVPDIKSMSYIVNSDDIVAPCATSSPQRSASQNAAIEAVLGYDVDEDEDVFFKEVDKKTGCESCADKTADLSEDEIAAVIPPNLQRHSGNSSPGAFRVNRSGGYVAHQTSRTPHATRRRVYPETDDCNDGMHVISATLVDHESYASDISQDAPVLVHAERLWWKRRLWMCISVWMLLAVAVASVSTVFAIRLTNQSDITVAPAAAPAADGSLKVESDGDSKGGSDGDDVSLENENSATTNVSFTPSMSPVDITLFPISDPPGTNMSTYSVSWGVLTSCIDFQDELDSYEMVINCGGIIDLEKYDNVSCKPILGPNMTLDDGRLSCRLNKTEDYVQNITSGIYRQSAGLALFTCKGTDDLDLMATAKLSNVIVSNCSMPFVDIVSTFVSLGRFCEYGTDSVTLRDDFSKCGQPGTCLITDCREECELLPLFSLPPLFQLPRFESQCSYDSAVYGDIIDLLDPELIQSFCYGTVSCSDQNCTLGVPMVYTQNRADTFSPCKNPGNNETDVDMMWILSETRNDPSARFDLLFSTSFV